MTLRPAAEPFQYPQAQLPRRLTVRVVSFCGAKEVVVDYDGSFASATTVETAATDEDIGDAIVRALERLADRVPELSEAGEL